MEWFLIPRFKDNTPFMQTVYPFLHILSRIVSNTPHVPPDSKTVQPPWKLHKNGRGKIPLPFCFMTRKYATRRL